jgi:hypothetical protein
MAWKLSVEQPGSIHHEMNRVDRREPISRDAPDQERFVETLVTLRWIAQRGQHEHTAGSMAARREKVAVHKYCDPFFHYRFHNMLIPL